MSLWTKRVRIFNSIREHGKSSIRRLAERTGLSKSSVHRHLQATERRDRYPESGLWETPEGRNWLLRLVVATLFTLGVHRLSPALTMNGCASHAGRRTCMTHAARRVSQGGGSLRDVQELAGHPSVAMTPRDIEGDTEAKRTLVALL